MRDLPVFNVALLRKLILAPRSSFSPYPGPSCSIKLFVARVPCLPIDLFLLSLRHHLDFPLPFSVFIDVSEDDILALDLELELFFGPPPALTAPTDLTAVELDLGILLSHSTNEKCKAWAFSSGISSP